MTDDMFNGIVWHINEITAKLYPLSSFSLFRSTPWINIKYVFKKHR